MDWLWLLLAVKDAERQRWIPWRQWLLYPSVKLALSLSPPLSHTRTHARTRTRTFHSFIFLINNEIGFPGSRRCKCRGSMLAARLGLNPRLISKVLYWTWKWRQKSLGFHLWSWSWKLLHVLPKEGERTTWKFYSAVFLLASQPFLL